MQPSTVYEDERKIGMKYFYRFMWKYYCQCGNWVGVADEEQTKEISRRSFMTIARWRENFKRWDGDFKTMPELPPNWDEM
jgi:hypothetical protein